MSFIYKIEWSLIKRQKGYTLIFWLSQYAKKDDDRNLLQEKKLNQT